MLNLFMMLLMGEIYVVKSSGPSTDSCGTPLSECSECRGVVAEFDKLFSVYQGKWSG